MSYYVPLAEVRAVRSGEIRHASSSALIALALDELGAW